MGIIRFNRKGFLHTFPSCVVSVTGRGKLFSNSITVIGYIPFNDLRHFSGRSGLCAIVLQNGSGNRIIGSTRIIADIRGTVNYCRGCRSCVTLTQLSDLHFIVSGAARTNVILSGGSRLRNVPRACPNGLARFLFRHCGTFRNTRSGKLVLLPIRLVSSGNGRLGGYILSLTRV